MNPYYPNDYDKNFTEELKKIVRDRDDNACFLCNHKNSKNYSKLAVHHVDLNKRNSCLKNLITICDTHHGMIHRKDEKDIWISRILYLMKHIFKY